MWPPQADLCAARGPSRRFGVSVRFYGGPVIGRRAALGTDGGLQAKGRTMTTIDTGEGCIAYSDSGVGEPVVMLHCTTASGSEWRSLRAALGNDHRTIAPDQWDCGASDPWPGRRSFSLAEEAAPVIAILERLGRPAHLIGHSYGGAVALRVARMAPDLLQSLTLVEPSSFHLLRFEPDGPELLAEIGAVAESVAWAVMRGHGWSGMGCFIDYWSGDGAWAALPGETKAKMAQRLPKVLLDFGALLNEPCGIDAHATVTVPTLILCGERTRAPSRRIVEMLAKIMPEARLETITEAGHMSPLTHPEPVNAAIAAHLRLWRADAVEAESGRRAA
jgi:pimeloyl-ACP methyl ester carboxylesterase